MEWLLWLIWRFWRQQSWHRSQILPRRQDVSLPYLEQLFVKLRRSGLVESVRGPGGGYRLGKLASEIRVVDILAAVDETVDAMHKGAGASGALSGSRAQSCDQSLMGRAQRAGLCLSASDTVVRCGLEHSVALSGSAKPF